ncbi:hypothetical protein Q5H93_12985 [Hymenobacter sp. ASUV-10]|uniref:Entericidin n=1 Tax=Hymenobacter aranciens TaxID=3063996 RepID=A0ABT9BF48_9BACT|nr:hypothetical protein [Hymenobacter sp. ASUV-10]MDO7875652.1 hypothetical protein [Hymenobacter sp. ASUV-10]
MKISLNTLFVAAALAFATASCTDKQQENAEATTENAADATGAAVEGAVTPDHDGANTAMPENGDTAVVRDQPANGVVDQVPAKQ